MRTHEINYPELDVDQLMSSIREAVERRGIDLTSQSSDVAAAGSRVNRSTLLFDLPAPPLSLSPEFERRSDGKYHVKDLLKYHDREFVQHAYQAILKREPDEQGYRDFTEMLRSGQRNKVDVLGSLSFSPEGRKHHLKIEGLLTPLLIQRLARIPVLGYFVRLTWALVRLPGSIRRQDQTEAHLQAVNNYLNQTSVWMAHNLEKHGLAVEDLIAREGDTQEELMQAESATRLAAERVKQLSQILQQTRKELIQQDAYLKSIGTETPGLAPGLAQSIQTPERRELWDSLYYIGPRLRQR